MHQVAELLLRMVGDADGGDVAIQQHPFVFFWVKRLSTLLLAMGAFLSAHVSMGDKG